MGIISMKNWAIFTIRLKDMQRSIVGYAINEINSMDKLDLESQLDFLGWKLSERLNCSVSYNVYISEEIKNKPQTHLFCMEGFVQDGNFGFGWHFPSSKMAYSLYTNILAIYRQCGATDV